MAMLSVFRRSKVTRPSAPDAGLARGAQPGHLTVWIGWDPAANPTEVFRAVLKVESPDRKIEVPAVSYTFAPAFELPSAASLETTYDIRQFLVGSDRAKQGTVTVELWLSGGQVLRKTYGLAEVIRWFRGRGSEAPAWAVRVERYFGKDTPEIAGLTHGLLKDHSEKIKAALEAKRRKEEEEAKKREEERLAAAAKAAEAAKALAAKAGGATAAAAPKAAAPTDRTKPTLPGGKSALFYGSSTGNTAEVARMIKEELGEALDHVKNITEITPPDFAVCDRIILGIPTWHIGELQDDWAAVLPELDGVSLQGKKVAIFGLGDAKGYPDTYVDAMQELWEKFQSRGASLVGLWPTDGYDFQKSKATKDGKFLGLVIDVENQNEMTDRRVKDWVTQLRSELL